MERLLEALRPGQHLALLYRNRAEQFETVIPFIRLGLARGERCLYVASDNSVGVVLKALREAGIDVDSAQSAGALTVATNRETFLKGGIFVPERMIELLRGEVRRALADGFSGFRGTGEMTWAVTHTAALCCLHEYEDSLDANFPRQFTGLCQYREDSFERNFISGVLRNHPKIIARGRLIDNPYYFVGGTAAEGSRPIVNVEDLLERAV